MELTAYRQFAELEEKHFWFRGRRRIFFHLLDHHLEGRHDLNVLEVGCGAGGFLRRLSRYGRATGLELSREFSLLSHETSGRPTVCASAYEIPLQDASQELICLFDTLEHIPDEARALSEIFRVLRPGGVAFFSVPAYQFLYANNDRIAHHCRRYTWRRLENVLCASGFVPIKMSYFNTFLFPAILPAVLLMKFKERWIGLRDPEHTNLSVKVPRAVSEVLYRIMSSERHLLRRFNFRFGHSLIGIVRRPVALSQPPPAAEAPL
jgi:SAM-dependent methyltransferase